MHPGQQENQMSNLCEFVHPVFPVTPTEQPGQKEMHQLTIDIGNES